ncbi:hypothetical protein GCM10023238_11660 [Streptomyces heliomycini]
MLLRRLAAATGAARPGRPPGIDLPRWRPRRPSARERPARRPGALLDVAARVFGMPFAADAVVGEERMTADEFTGAVDYELPEPPSPRGGRRRGVRRARRRAAARPAGSGRARHRLLGRSGLDAFRVGRLLKRHDFTLGVLSLLDGEPLDEWTLRDRLGRFGYSWGRTARENPRLALQALSRFVALLSAARDPDYRRAPAPAAVAHRGAPVGAARDPRAARSRTGPRVPLVRGRPDRRTPGRPLNAAPPGRRTRMPPPAVCRRTRRAAGRSPCPAPTPRRRPAQVHLPAVYCRNCGRSGWAALSPRPTRSSSSPRRTASGGPASAGTSGACAIFIAATPGERRQTLDTLTGARPSNGGVDPLSVVVLDGSRGTYRLPTPRGRRGNWSTPVRAGRPRPQERADRAAKDDRCPACHTDNSIRSSAPPRRPSPRRRSTQLFTGGDIALVPEERKTLLFNDSTQDAAHRAGYVANASYKFSLRSLLATQPGRIKGSDRAQRPDRAGPGVGGRPRGAGRRRAPRPARRAGRRPAAVRPGHGRRTDLAADRRAAGLRDGHGVRAAQPHGPHPGIDPDRSGRGDGGRPRRPSPTSPGTCTWPCPANCMAVGGLPTPERYLAYVPRSAGAAAAARRGAAPLARHLDQGGRHQPHTSSPGAEPDGMPAFPEGVAPPRFLLDGQKDGSEFDAVTGRLGWYQDLDPPVPDLDAAGATRVPAQAAAPPRRRRCPVGAHHPRPADPGCTGLQPGHIR